MRNVTLVLAAVCLSVCALAAGLVHATTKGLVNENVFLKNYRRLFWEESLLSQKMEYVLGSAEANDVLFVGDSTCLMGLDPLRFEAKTGLRAYNLCTMGWLSPDAQLEILERYLERHPRPRFIVYTLWPDELTDGYSENEAFKDRFVWAYAPNIRKERGLVRWPLEFRLREEFRTFAGLLTRGHARYFKEELVPGITYDGLGELLRNRRGFFALATRKPVEPYAGNLKVGSIQGSRFQKFVRYVDAEKIPLLIRLAPTPGAASAGQRRDFTEWFGRLKASFSRVVVDEPPLLEYPDSFFGDARHLDAAGAAALTDKISRAAPALGGKK